MPYSKQELLDWIEYTLPDDAVIAFMSHEISEEVLIDHLLLDLTKLEEEELLDLDLCCDDETATHVVLLT